MARPFAPRRGRRRTRAALGSVRALDRGLSVLEALGDGREQPLSEIARRVQLPYSTAHRLLETLARRGFVVQQRATGLYRIGIRAFEVGAALTQGRLYELAHARMKELADEFNETVNLAVLDGREAVIVHQVEARRFAGLFTHPGTRAPLHATAIGKALLAGRAADEVTGLLGPGPLPAFTKNTLTRTPEILRAVERVRQQGFAIDDEERELGLRCVAVPIRTGGETVAALSVAAPASRLPKTRLAKIARRLGEISRAIASQLGGRLGGL